MPRKKRTTQRNLIDKKENSSYPEQEHKALRGVDMQTQQDNITPSQNTEDGKSDIVLEDTHEVYLKHGNDSDDTIIQNHIALSRRPPESLEDRIKFVKDSVGISPRDASLQVQEALCILIDIMNELKNDVKTIKEYLHDTA